MKTPHPLLQDGMIVWKGKDERKDFCYYTYDYMRLWEQKRSICFMDMVPVAEKLGFEIVPHWTLQGQIKGYCAVRGLQYHGPFDSVEDVEISPIAKMIINDSINNQSMKSLLSMEDESNDWQAE